MFLLRPVLGAVVLCAALLLVAPASAQTTTSSAVGAAASETKVLRAIERQVQQIRGLAALSEPDLRFLDQAALRKFLVDQFDRDYLPSERESDQKEWGALGLIQPTDDLVQIQLDLLSDQVVGVYDPQDKVMVVLAESSTFGPSARITYAHEFGHALQDQHYELNRLAPKHPESNDRSMAVHALIEGDAVMLQSLWAQANLSQNELITLARSSSGSDDGLARVPLVVRADLLFPYVEGFNFVRQTYRQAGNSYAAVDELFKNPPESTAQILHPEKYRNHVHPVDVQLPDVGDQLGPDWRQLGNGVLGELETRALLEQWGNDHAEAVRVAAGWSGDRWQLVEKDGRSAIALKSTWESPDAARAFFSTYARGLRARFGSAATEESSPTRQALTTPVAATDLRLQDSEVLAIIAFDRAAANAIVDAVIPSVLSPASSPG